MNDKVVALIQARMSSTRLPGKTLLELDKDFRIIDSVYQRISMSNLIDKVVIATSIDKSDDILFNYCRKKGYLVKRGNLKDVLTRFQEIIKEFSCKYVVRVTADCPFVDVYINDLIIKDCVENDLDYSAVYQGRIALGLSTECIKKDVLTEAYYKAKGVHREHVTSFIYKSGLYKCNRIIPEKNLYEKSSKYRLTLDTPEDYFVIRNVYLGIQKKFPDTEEIVAFLENNNKIARANLNVKQKGIE